MEPVRQQVQIDAPASELWSLLGDPNRHPEWWPRMIEIECEEAGAGCSYRQVATGPFGKFEEIAILETYEDCREIKVRCESGTYMRWVLTEAQGGTFVDAEFGADPTTLGPKVFARLGGRRWFRKWLAESIASLKRAATRTQATPG